MKLSDKGLLEIAEHEGIVPAPYLDSVGVWTFGVGHTKNAGGLDPAQMPKGMPEDFHAGLDLAVETFREDAKKYEDRVNKAIKVPLEQHEFDALVSFDLNTGGIHRAKLTKRINAGDQNASESFFGWLRPPELRKRRTAEKNLFDTGDYDANGTKIPVWGVNEKGKLTGVIAQMSGHEFLSRMKPNEPIAVDYDKNPEPEAEDKPNLIAVILKLIFSIFRK